ncbi:MAG: hypothetical protein IKA57_06130 [Clostridia bacterium]|nr:hypothetical protein [Clostridia bacterium]
MKAFFGKIGAWIKSTATKVWKWSVAHKAIAITTASVVVAGTTCAIVLPIALHDHSYAAEWSSDATNHWHEATCKHEEEISDLAAHVYANDCDDTCDTCGYTRTVGAHVYDNACDTTCNVCNAERTVEPHVYDNACDTTCNVCNAERTVGAHVYDNACDTDCNECGATRTITHDHADTLTAGETTHWYACSVCGDKKDETAHAYTLETVNADTLKTAATATTKAVYYKSCVCGAIATTDEFTFETDKLPANLQVLDISKTYDGTPVAEPTVTFDGVGAENFAYYKGDEKLTERPTDAGTYKVVVTVDETDTHASDLVEREFTIAEKTLNYLIVTKVYNGERGFGENAGIYCQLGVDHGVIAGDTVFLETSDDIPYNVGTYYFVRMNSTDDRDTVWLLGDDAANYDFYGDDVVGEITVTPKTLNYLELTKVYNGKEGFNDSFDRGYVLGAEHGVVSDDVVILGTNDDIEYNVGTYVLSDSSGNWSLNDSCYLVGADCGNYQFNYKENGAVATITVTKRPIWAENTEFVYDGSENFCGDEYPVAILQNVVAGDLVELSDITWYFDSKNVGATLVKVDLSEEYNPNYTIDFSKCSASINPRVIDNLTYSFEYNGMEYRQAIISKNEHSDIVNADEITLEVGFVTPNAGAALDTSEETGFEPSFIEENYVLGTTYEFSIIPREIWVTDAQFYYDGYTTMMDDVAVNGITIHNAASTEDESYMGGFFVFRFEDSDVGSNLVNVTLSGLEESFINNYKINVSKCEAEIIPMELTNLNVQITENTFETGSAYLNATNGVVYGDEVYITWTESGHNNTAMWKERGSDLVAPREGIPLQGQAQVTLEGADASNYTLVITNNKYGTMTYSEKCKPDVYGYCNCGANHTISTFKSTDVIATVPVGYASWEGGIYALNTTEPGYWNIQPNENYCTVTVYSPYGYKVTMKGFEFEATMAGTYYVHITKNSATASGDAITFRYAERIFDVSSNQSGFYESNNLAGVNGAYYYFKVNKDTNWGASLLLKDGDENVLDAAKYEVKLYDTNFNEITDFIYDGSNIYDPADENKSIVGTNFYIMVTLKADTEFYICVF